MKNIITILLLSISIYSYAQSCTNVEELFRKRHKISGMNYGHPYTTFDRHNGLSLDSTFANIRKRIIEESPESIQGPIFKAYQEIYNNAVSPMPLDNGLDYSFSDGKVEKCENYNDSRLCGVGDENGLGEIDGINSGTANNRGKGQDQGQNTNNTLPIFTTMEAFIQAFNDRNPKLKLVQITTP